MCVLSIWGFVTMNVAPVGYRCNMYYLVSVYLYVLKGLRQRRATDNWCDAITTRGPLDAWLTAGVGAECGTLFGTGLAAPG